jgi:hypothetical protein
MVLALQCFVRAAKVLIINDSFSESASHREKLCINIPRIIQFLLIRLFLFLIIKNRKLLRFDSFFLLPVIPAGIISVRTVMMM